VAPPLYFNPVVPGMKVDRTRRPFHAGKPVRVTRPQKLEDTAFWSVTQLAELIRTKQVKSVELAEMYLDRLKRYSPKLACASPLPKTWLCARRATLTARSQTPIIAGRATDSKGVKDLCAAKGYPIAWGAAPFKTRIIDEDATDVSRLHAAGAVLVAKLATGELPIGSAGKRKNPWDLLWARKAHRLDPVRRLPPDWLASHLERRLLDRLWNGPASAA